VDAQPPDQDGLEAFVRFYRSAEHRDQCADDCPSAALRDEIVRRPDATRQVFTDELMGVIDDVAARLDPTDVAAARTDALTVFGLMVGTLQVVRALTDRDLSDQLLARGVQTALALLDDRASDAGVTREPRRALAAS
jgi:TetR/AcrR family transcriptional regulator, transcriptional repressor for nem operon